MRYILERRYRLRGWQDKPAGVYDTELGEVRFPGKEAYLMLMKCDGSHDIDKDALDETHREILESLEKDGLIRPAGFFGFMAPEQLYKAYPNVYREEVHWSVTGACNLKCRHCFMSAPHAKHGVPTHEQIMNVVEQFAECGIYKASLTGGEPLIRDDFLEIIDALKEHEIIVSAIFTNGWLVDGKFLDELEKRNVHPSFQLSFDGIGVHDRLRGVPGAEERTVRAIKLLKERGYGVSAALCMNKLNRDKVRDSVKYLAELGVSGIKISASMVLGEWADPEVSELRLSSQEELEFIEQYIPQYFEDNAPMSMVLSGAFSYTPGSDSWDMYYRSRCGADEEARALSCRVLEKAFYVGADGMTAPCMGMADCGYSENFPNMFTTPLTEILAAGSDFTVLCGTTVAEVRDKGGKCRGCKYIDRCAGGCRNSALLHGNNYYAPDEDNCYFFENGWEERITAVAQPAFEAYLKRCSTKARQDSAQTAIQ